MIHVDVSGERERMIRNLLQAGKFPSADAVIDEALRLVGQRYEDQTATHEIAEASNRTAERLENLKRLGRELDAMPAAAVVDGLSNRDHDRILYGR